MEGILKRVRLQGALGAICILAAGATYFIKGEPEFLKVVRLLAWLLAFVFLYYAIANVQRLSGSNVFTIFKRRRAFGTAMRHSSLRDGQIPRGFDQRRRVIFSVRRRDSVDSHKF